jgi:hypothetical protein
LNVQAARSTAGEKPSACDNNYKSDIPMTKRSWQLISDRSRK